MDQAAKRIEHERRWLAYHKARKGTSDQQKARVDAKFTETGYNFARRAMDRQKDARVAAKETQRQNLLRHEWMRNRRDREMQERVRAKQKQAEERRKEEERRDQAEREKQAWSYMYQTPEWRFLDRPRPGSVYRLPDNTALQRGITFTVIPDGRRMQVPPVFRNEVQALAEKHQA